MSSIGQPAPYGNLTCPETPKEPVPDAPPISGNSPLGVAAIGRSLFLPDIELA